MLEQPDDVGAGDVWDDAALLRAFALGLPGAWEDFPWGDRVIKVGKKIFVFLSGGEDLSRPFGLGVKLPSSGEAALQMPNVKPTAYNLGKSGWISARFGPEGRLPTALVQGWVEESYRAVAPKKLIRELDLRPPSPLLVAEGGARDGAVDRAGDRAP